MEVRKRRKEEGGRRKEEGRDRLGDELATAEVPGNGPGGKCPASLMHEDRA
jgi:hypothetical protein